jgi:hypothetical protein
VNLGWHRDRKENPISAPSIHVGALVGAASLWTRESKNNCEKNITESNWITPTGRQAGRQARGLSSQVCFFFDISPTSLQFNAHEKKIVVLVDAKIIAALPWICHPRKKN